MFDAFLGGLDRLVEPRVFERFAFLHAEAFHHRGHAVGGGEVAHEVILEGDEELRASGVALAGAAAAELAVGAAGFVAFGANHEESAEFGDSGCEFDVGTAAGHVGGNCHRAGVACAGNDFRFLFVELCVEDRVGDLGALEHAREGFGGVHRGRAHEAGLTDRVGFLDFGDHRIELFAARLEDLIVFVDAVVRAIGRDGQDIETVDVVKLGGFGFGGAGHAREFFVEAEVILNRDGREGLGFLLNGHAFLRLDRLMESVGPTAAGHFAAGVFIDDDDLVVLHDILHILFENAVGFEELGNVVDFFRLRIHAGLERFLGSGFLRVVEIAVGVDVGIVRAEIGEREGIRVAG